MPDPSSLSKPTPREIRKTAGGKSIKISWADGHQSEWTAALLRDHCRCAACVSEFTGERLHKIGSAAPDLTILKLEPIGQYALGFLFSDGHSTGIYTFDYLRNLASS